MTEELYDQALIPCNEEYVYNSYFYTLYNSKFKENNGNYLSIILPEQDQEYFDIQTSPRIRLRLAYRNDSIKGLTFSTYENGKEKGNIKLSSFTLGHITEFLEIIKSLNISDLTHSNISLNLNSESDIKNTLTTLITKTLDRHNQIELVQQFLNNGLITDQDIVNTGYRKLALQKFEKLLNNENYIQIYKMENNLENSNLEKVWQHFFENNEWIFGYGLDYKFQAILQREVHLNTPFLDQTNAVLADFLLGDKKFTTFVEIKRPDTQLFCKEFKSFRVLETFFRFI